MTDVIEYDEFMVVWEKETAETYRAEYTNCFGKLFKRIAVDKLTIAGVPMALFHSSEFSPSGLDTEFAVPVQECATGTRDFCPGLSLKTVVHSAYTQLSSVYAKQIKWAEKEGYRGTNALFEAYVTDPSQAAEEVDHITEVYYPVKKISSKACAVSDIEKGTNE